jgi:hypothetical protein
MTLNTGSADLTMCAKLTATCRQQQQQCRMEPSVSMLVECCKVQGNHGQALWWLAQTWLKQPHADTWSMVHMSA